ncbi:MAG: hypothetical protein RLZZ232_1161 [Planctomycetota bacterium]
MNAFPHSLTMFRLAGLLLSLLLNSLPAQESQQPTAGSEEQTQEDWIWLRNPHLKVGLLRKSGGAIAWISQADKDHNLINHFDRGRLIQQSWYGSLDGSDWNGQPWRWNPVQGGDWRGKSSKLLDQQVTTSHAQIRTQPVHWATGQPVEDVIMEQTVTLQQELVHIRFRFHYTGQISHPAHHQELPALFVDPKYATLVTYDGSQPWTGQPVTRRQPGWPNEYHPMTEHWAAWVDDSDFGIGCYVPAARQLTCYRFGNGDEDRSACSYLAPIDTIAVMPGFEKTWDVWLTPGTTAVIRDRFRQLSER